MSKRRFHNNRWTHFLLFQDEIGNLSLPLQTKLLKYLDDKEKCKSDREMATYLKISQSTVVRKMKKYGMSYDVMR